MRRETLKQRMIRELDLPLSAFRSKDTHLYVVSSPGVEQWLKENYKDYKDVVKMINFTEGDPWFFKDIYYIPYAYKEFFAEMRDRRRSIMYNCVFFASKNCKLIR